MKTVGSVLKSIAIPVVVVGLFLIGALYEQEILVRLGMATVAQFRSVVPYILHIGIWLSLAYLLNRVVGIAVWDPLNRRMPVPRLLRDVTAVLIYAVAITGIISVVFNKPIGPIWAASGAGAIVIGLALRNVILDIFIGLAMNFDRPFEIGDFIQVTTGPLGGPSGRVVELNWRTTRLLTGEGNLVVVPNGKLGDMIVTNFSKPESMGEFELSVFLDFDVPTDRALRVLNAAVRSVSGTTGIPDDPAPKARIRGVSPQGVEYKIKYLLDPRKAGPGKARHEVWRAVLDQLHRAGLQPAMPKQDVFHAERPVRQLDSGATADRIAILSRVELFHGLTAEERALLAVAMRPTVFKEGAKLITRGEPGESMFILNEGLLDVMIALKPDQPEARVARLPAGAFFGEMSALTGEPRSATIVAATDALVFEIAKSDLVALVQRRPEVAEVISRAVAARKLRNSEAAAQAGSPARVNEERSLAAQVVTKMLAFFGVKRRSGLSAHEIEQNASMSPFS